MLTLRSISCMDIEEMKRIVKANLSDKRYAHTLRVTKCALTLAERFDVTKEKVQIAALFHDYAKDESSEKLRQLIKDYHLPESLLQYHDEQIGRASCRERVWMSVVAGAVKKTRDRREI